MLLGEEKLAINKCSENEFERCKGKWGNQFKIGIPARALLWLWQSIQPRNTITNFLYVLQIEVLINTIILPGL